MIHDGRTQKANNAMSAEVKNSRRVPFRLAGLFRIPTEEIFPVDDLMEHIPSEACRCMPVLTIIDGAQRLTHNSFDGREHNPEDEKHIRGN